MFLLIGSSLAKTDLEWCQLVDSNAVVDALSPSTSCFVDCFVKDPIFGDYNEQSCFGVNIPSGEREIIINTGANILSLIDIDSNENFRLNKLDSNFNNLNRSI